MVDALTNEQQRLQDYADELSKAERQWQAAKEGAERLGWQVHLLGPIGQRQVRVYPPPKETP